MSKSSDEAYVLLTWYIHFNFNNHIQMWFKNDKMIRSVVVSSTEYVIIYNTFFIISAEAVLMNTMIIEQLLKFKDGNILIICCKI